ncbi:MAG: hypothetical protein ACLFV2_09900 [Desulfurivibrionaceae bacterium]
MSPVKVDSILVLPADVPLEAVGNEEGQNAQSLLNRGAETLSDLMKSKARESERMVFLSPNRMQSILGDYNGSEQEMIRYLGKETEADAVLSTRIFRYVKRSGSKYSVSQPASVNFSYKLVHTSTGGILCHGQFNETQEPLFADLFSFFKSLSRGFKWITADALLTEGMEQEFKECTYLNRE